MKLIYRLYNTTLKTWDGRKFKDAEEARTARRELADCADWAVIMEVEKA